jgi:hypothetical protein
MPRLYERRYIAAVVRRLVLIVGLLLLWAAPATAAYSSPRLVVSNAGAGMRLGVVVANTDDPTARFAVYVPTGYRIDVPKPGAKLGLATATAWAQDLGGAILPFSGEVDNVDPSTLSEGQRAGIAGCLGGQVANQTWMLHLLAAGQTLDVPILMVPAAPTEAGAGYQAILLVCLPASGVPKGTPGRAVLGSKLLSITFGTSVIRPPLATGDSRWTATFTPLTPGTAAVNTAATVETQSVHRHPTLLKLHYTASRVVTSTLVKGKRVRTVGTRVTFSSTVTEAGKHAAGPVSTTAGGKVVGKATGSFVFTGPGVTLTARGSLHQRWDVPSGAGRSSTDLYYADDRAAGCTKTPIFGGIPCVGSTVGRTTPRASVHIAGFLR